MWGGVFLGSLLMGKGTCALWCPFLSPMTNPLLSGPAACDPSLGCTSLALTLAPAPAAPNKGGGQHLPFSSPKSPQSGQPQGSSQLHLFSHQYNLPGGNQLRAGSCWCQVKAAEGTLWVCAICHTLLALGEASNASSQPWQCCGRTALSPSGMLPGILLFCQAAKPPWLMFRSACMGSSTYLGVGGIRAFATLISVLRDAYTSWIGGAWTSSPLQGSLVSHHSLRGHSHYLLCCCNQHCHLRAFCRDSSISPTLFVGC